MKTLCLLLATLIGACSPSVQSPQPNQQKVQVKIFALGNWKKIREGSIQLTYNPDKSSLNRSQNYTYKTEVEISGDDIVLTCLAIPTPMAMDIDTVVNFDYPSVKRYNVRDSSDGTLLGVIDTSLNGGTTF